MVTDKNNQPGGRAMKRAIVSFAVILSVLSLIVVTDTGNVSAAGGNVYYSLPYLHTHASNVTYCVVSNLSTDNVTSASFTVKASSGSTPTRKAIAFPSSVSFGGSSSNLISFTGKYVYVGTTKAADLSTDLGLSSTTTNDNTTSSSDNTTGSGKGGNDKGENDKGEKDNSSNSGKSEKIYYGGTLTFTSDSSIDCQKIAMSCFQGTTNPKRPIGGYTCTDDSSTGPSGGKNVLSY